MTPSGKTIRLDMIVKNDVENLERCLGSVADHVSCWVICGIGSTGGTPDLVRHFSSAEKTSGELHRFAFETFEQARMFVPRSSPRDDPQYGAGLSGPRDASAHAVTSAREFAAELADPRDGQPHLQ